MDNIVNTTYWRDLELGEKILPGDRCYGRDQEWFTVTEANLEFSDTINECSYPHQRKASVLIGIDPAEGYALVPVEPTEAMRLAVYQAEAKIKKPLGPVSVYKTMINAAKGE